MRLCFIANMNSIHVKKWVQFFCERGHDVQVISSSYYTEPTFHSANVVNIPRASARHFSRSLLSNIRLLGVAKKLRSVSQKMFSLLLDDVIYKKAERLAPQIELQELQTFINLVNTTENKVRDLVYSFKPDLVQCLRLIPEGLLGSCFDFQPRILFGWGQDISFWCTKYSELAELARRALSQCTAYFADNYRDIKDAHRYGLPEERFWHITPSGGGVETDKLQRVGLHSVNGTGPTTFLTYRRIGNYFIDNRPVLRAIKILREREKLNVRFKIIGYPTGPYYDIVRIEAKRLGISNYIEFEAPFPYSKLGEIISKYEFIVSSATHDGTTNALLETMWLGGIPLNSDLEPIREWITDGVNGYLFNINNPEHIAQKFIQAMSERQKHDEFRVMNQDIIRTRADYNTCMSEVEKIYQEIIGRSLNSERTPT